MNENRLVTKYPKSIALLKRFWINRMKSQQEYFLRKLSEEDRKENIFDLKEIPDEFLDNLIALNIRALYDFFDENGEVITISHRLNTFSFSINNLPSNKNYNNREQAEVDAFDLSFQNLERTLTLKEENV